MTPAGVRLLDWVPTSLLIEEAIRRLPDADPDLELAVLDRPVINHACRMPHLRKMLMDEQGAKALEQAARLITYLQARAEPMPSGRSAPKTPAEQIAERPAPTEEEAWEAKRRCDRAHRPIGPVAARGWLGGPHSH